MPNQEIIGQWGESAPYWEKYRPVITEMFAPVTQALIDDANIAKGNSVLDVATGTGEPALTIAALVGSEGSVMGTDVVPEMLDAARREAASRELRQLRFQLAFTDSLPFPDSSFDAVVSRFGVMFFPAPLECLRELLRVLKPGRRIAMAVWYLQEKNPFDTVVSRIVDRYMERYLEPTTPKPGSSDMFRFAKNGDLLALLVEAGATAASERLLQFPIRAGLSAEEFWTLRSEMSEKMRTKLRLLAEPQQEELKREAIDAIRAYSVSNGISIPAEVLIVSGAKAVPA